MKVDEKVKKDQKHILVITQYFYPEYFRINDICKEWATRGYQVTVLTWIPNYPKGKYFEGYGLFQRRNERYMGINIIRVPIIPRGHNSLMLALNYVSFVISGFFWSVFAKIQADYVFIYEVSPMTQALPGIWYAKRHKIPCYLYVTDLWPENVEAVAGISNKYILNTIGKLVDYIYKHCDRIFTSSESFIDAIQGRGINKDRLEFWPQYAEDYYKPVVKEEVDITEIPLDGIFNIVFAGNIGFAQGLDILPNTAKVLQKKKLRVRFNIIGDGRYKEKLMADISEHQVEAYFNLIPQQPAMRIPDFMALGDAALISLSKNKAFAITLPSKLQSCLACGIPILVSADGEIQSVIEKAKAGLYSNAADPKSLADNSIELMNMSMEQRKTMADNARDYYHKNFDKEILLRRLDKWFVRG